MQKELPLITYSRNHGDSMSETFARAYNYASLRLPKLIPFWTRFDAVSKKDELRRRFENVAVEISNPKDAILNESLSQQLCMDAAEIYNLGFPDPGNLHDKHK